MRDIGDKFTALTIAVGQPILNSSEADLPGRSIKPVMQGSPLHYRDAAPALAPPAVNALVLPSPGIPTCAVGQLTYPGASPMQGAAAGEQTKQGHQQQQRQISRLPSVFCGGAGRQLIKGFPYRII